MENIEVNFKKVVIVAATVGVFFSSGLGVKSLADGFWVGHEDIQIINSSINTLKDRVKNKSDEVTRTYIALAATQRSLDEQKSQVQGLNAQLTQVTSEKEAAVQANAGSQSKLVSVQQQLTAKEAEIQDKINEINQKIDEGNKNVAAKQTELDAANAQIDSLHQELDAAHRAASNNDGLSEVQQARQQAEQAVKETAGSSSAN